MSLHPPTAQEIDAARDRIAGAALRTPLVRLDVDLPFELWIKLESLQPIGSFKLRGALNAIRSIPRERLSRGVYTASAGNMAQGVAWGARELGVPCTVLVPDTAPRTKLDAIARLGASVRPLSHADWWQVLVDHGRADMQGEFIHPVANQDVLAGNATIGAELLEDLGDTIAGVLVPHGGGGQAVGIASAMRTRTSAPVVYACEVATAAPFSAALHAGRPAPIEFAPSFVDGIGGRSVLQDMWPLTSGLLAGSFVMSVAEIASAIRLLATRARVVAEGAGAVPVAAAIGNALHLSKRPGRWVASISGGNIDLDVLRAILANEI